MSLQPRAAGGATPVDDDLAVAEDSASVQANVDARKSRGSEVSRRGFLLSTAAPMVAPTIVNHLVVSPVFRRTQDGFELRCADEILWRVDVAWLAPPSGLRISENQRRIRVMPARQKGLRSRLGLEISVLASARGTCLRIAHALWSCPVQVELTAWLSAAIEASAPVRAQGVLYRDADLVLVQRREAELTLGRDLAMRLQGADAFISTGRRAQGVAKACLIGPVTRDDDALPPGHGLTVVLEAGPTSTLRVQPREIQEPGLRVNAFDAARVGVAFETATRSQREPARPHFFAQAREAVVDHRAASAGMNARVRLLDATYWTGPTMQGVAARSAQVTVRAEDAVLSGSTQEGVRMTSDSTSCQIQCHLNWGEVSFVHEHGISALLRIRSADVLRPGSSDVDAPVREFLRDFPWHPADLDLGNAELEFMRPDDGLWLRFRFRGFSLSRGLTGFRLRRRDPFATLSLVLPPQAIAEQAFFEQPNGWKAAAGCSPSQPDPYGISGHSDDNEKRKNLGQPGSNADRPRSCDTGTDLRPTTLLATGRVADESALCFEPASSAQFFGVQLEDLLDPRTWRLVVAESAASSLQAWRKGSGQHGGSEFPTDITDLEQLAYVTHIEMPWRLQISPTEDCRIVHAPLTLPRHDAFRRLFYLSATSSSGGAAPFRAIYSPDHNPSESQLPLHDQYGPANEGQRRSLDGADRDELVWLTARWGRTGLLGSKNVRHESDLPAPAPCGRSSEDFGIYDPQPFLVDQLRLTAFGGGMRSDGQWDPPALRPALHGRGMAECDLMGLSVERWQHRSSLARTHWEQVDYRGWLMPFGFHATLIKLTRREITSWYGTPVANLVQRYFIRVVQPKLTMPLPGQPAISLNQVCQPETFELDLDHDLQIDDPNAANDPNHPEKPFNLNGRGQAAFVVHVANEAYLFSIKVGGKGKGTCALAFVDNSTTHDPAQLDDQNDGKDSVLKKYNDLPGEFRTLTHDGGAVCYAPPTKPGDTSFATVSIVFGMVVNTPLINSTLLESAQQPPLYPVVESSSILVRSIQTQTGQSVSANDPTAYRLVRYNAAYLATGFNVRTNVAEAFLDLDTPQPLGFRGRAQRSGGVANTDTTARSLSRSKGLLNFTPTRPATESAGVHAMALASGGDAQQDVESHAGFDLSARLLGTVRLVDILGALGIDDLPALLESAEQTLGKADDELNAWVKGVAGPAAGILNELEAQWTGLMPVKNWTSTKVYQQIEQPLAALRKALDNLGKASSTDAQLKAAAAIGPTLSALGSAVSSLARQPENAIVDLLSDELGQLLDVLDQLQKDIDAASVAVKALQDSASSDSTDLKSQIDACRDDVTATLDVASAQLSSRAQAVANDLAQQLSKLQDTALAHVDDFATVLQAAAQEYDAIYRLRQGLLDDAAVLGTAKLAQWQDFTAAAADLLGLVTVASFRQNVLDAARNWAIGMSAAYSQLPDAGAEAAFANAVRRVDSHVQRVQVLLRAMRNTELPALDLTRQNPPAPQTVNLEAFPRLALVLQQEAAGALDELVNIASPDKFVQALTSAVGQAVTALDSDLADALQPAQAAWMRLKDSVTQLLNVPEAANSESLNDLLQQILGNKRTQAAHVVPAPSDAAAVVLASICGLMDLPCGARALAGAANPSKCDWPFYDNVMKKALRLVQGSFGLVMPLLKLIAGMPALLPADPQEVLLLDSMLGKDFRPALVQLGKDASTVAALRCGTPAECATLCKTLREKDFPRQLSAIVLQIERLGSLGDLVKAALTSLQDEVKNLLESFVPTRITTTYKFSKTFTRDEGSVFLTGIGAAACSDVPADESQYHPTTDSRLTIQSTVVMDLLKGQADFHIDGELDTFQISILGFIALPVTQASFHSSATTGFKLDPPQFCTPDLKDGPLAFIAEIMELMGGGDGLFVTPGPNSIRAGYRIQFPNIETGGMAIQNFGFEAAIEIPFDDRAAEISIAMATPDAPVLLSIGIYGGGAYFGLTFSGDRVVAIAASFEAGLVGAFDILDVIEGSGRVTIGIVYRQSADIAVCGGTFYCGGHATVLSIVSIAADLSVSIVQSGSSATGTGHFSVRVGVGIFSWSLHYDVTHSQGSGSSGATLRALGKSQVATHDICPRPVATKLKNTVTAVDQLVCHWDEYIDAFMEVPA